MYLPRDFLRISSEIRIFNFSDPQTFTWTVTYSARCFVSLFSFLVLGLRLFLSHVLRAFLHFSFLYPVLNFTPAFCRIVWMRPSDGGKLFPIFCCYYKQWWNEWLCTYVILHEYICNMNWTGLSLQRVCLLPIWLVPLAKLPSIRWY